MKPSGGTPLLTKRCTKSKIWMKDLTGDRFIGAIPDFLFEPFDEKVG